MTNRLASVAGICLSLIFLTASAQQPKEPGPIAAQQPASTTSSLPVAEQLRKTVAFLTVTYRNGSTVGGVIGTCFFVSYLDPRLGENTGFLYLVTNRHVAQPGIDLGTPYDIQTASIRLNLATPTAQAQSVQESIQFGGRVQWHFPADNAVDLAVLPVGPDQKLFDFVSIPSNIIVTADRLKTGDVGVSDPIKFAGYFSNFPGHNRMEPIVREGVIAMVPQEDVETTLHKKGPIILADLHAFHGNSGSPVFVNIGGEHRRVFTPGENYLLLGVVSGYYPESAGFSVPAAAVLTGEVRDNSGITAIVPAYQLLDLLNSPELQADRDNLLPIVAKKK